MAARWGTLGFAGTQVLHGTRPHSNTQAWAGDGGEPWLLYASLELSLGKGGREEIMGTGRAALWGRGWLCRPHVHLRTHTMGIPCCPLTPVIGVGGYLASMDLCWSGRMIQRENKKSGPPLAFPR